MSEFSFLNKLSYTVLAAQRTSKATIVCSCYGLNISLPRSSLPRWKGVSMLLRWMHCPPSLQIPPKFLKRCSTVWFQYSARLVKFKNSVFFPFPLFFEARTSSLINFLPKDGSLARVRSPAVQEVEGLVFFLLYLKQRRWHVMKND